MKKILSILILTFLLFSCFNDKENKVEVPKQKTLQEYKQVWKDSFLYYQNNTKEIKKSWIFDAEFTVMIDGSEEALINKFSNLNLNSAFNSLSFKIDWDYDFLDKSTPKLNWNIKIYLNKRNFWLWDFDVSFKLENKTTLKYSVNNADKNLLKFLLTDKEKVDALWLYFEDNKGKELTYEIPKEVIDSLFEEASNVNLEENLYKNSKEEEQKIINSFLENEVIEVLSWETQNNIDKLNFKFNGDNCVKFLNDVAKILWNWNENKNFDSDKELLKNIWISWILEIKNNEIQNSFINSDIILAWNNSSWNKIEDKVNLKTTLKIVDYKNLNLDFTTLVSSDSTPDNKIQIRLKWLIK